MDKNALRKVLMIAFIYPPLGGSGVQRTLKFSKYLPEFGWRPYVVCSDDPQAFGDGLDHSLLTDIPEDVQFGGEFSSTRWGRAGGCRR